VTVWYLFSHQAAAEIRAFNPGSRIIILLRDPVALLYSLYHQFRADGNEQLPTFQAALMAEDDRRAGRRITRETYFRQGLDYRSIIRFTEQIRRYFDAFGRERVHVIVYDDFVADTAGIYRDTLNFLGVHSGHTGVDFKVISENKSAMSPALRALMNDPLVRGTAIALRPWLPVPIFKAVQKVGTNLCYLNLRAKPRPPLEPGLRLLLQREFAPEVERLSTLLGRDLTCWSKPEPAAAGGFSSPASAADESECLAATGTFQPGGGAFG